MFLIQKSSWLAVVVMFAAFLGNYGFVAIVLCLAALLVAAGLVVLNRAERKRVVSARRMEVSEAVETEAPEDDTESITRQRAMDSVRSRFYFIRRTYVPAVLLVAVLVISLYYLPSASAAYVSLICGVLVVLVGMMAKPVVENFISGVMITFAQPIRVGDTVIIDGRYGTVEGITMLYTIIKVWDWRRYVIPNQRLIQKEFENLSLKDEYEWVHIAFWVAPDSDLELVKRLAKSVMASSKFLERIERPSFWVMNLEKQAIECWIAGWAHTPANAWALKADTRKRLALAFQRAGIKFERVTRKVSVSWDNDQSSREQPPLSAAELEKIFARRGAMVESPGVGG